MANVELYTPSAHCGSCAAHIAEVLEDVDGVQGAALDLSSRVTTVDYDPQLVDVGQISAVVTDAGYPVEQRSA